MKEVKFSVFTDIHHHPGVFYTYAQERLEAIRRRAVENRVDFVIHCGDMSHRPSRVPEIIEQYAAFPMPTYHVLGNHEFDHETYEHVLEAYGLENGYYFFDCNGFRMIVLDMNNLMTDRKIVHYSGGNYPHPPEGTVRAAMGQQQLDWLEQTIMSAPGPCVLFSHHSLERIQGGLCIEELQQIWAMLRRVNSDKQRVMMAINGHYHRDYLRIFEGVAYFDLNSASMDWCDESHDRFPEELTSAYMRMNHQLLWIDPIHAVVTLREDGTIRIEGMKSRFFMDIDRQVLGYDLQDEDGRLCTPDVLSAEFKLNMNGIRSF